MQRSKYIILSILLFLVVSCNNNNESSQIISSSEVCSSEISSSEIKDTSFSLNVFINDSRSPSFAISYNDSYTINSYEELLKSIKERITGINYEYVIEGIYLDTNQTNLITFPCVLDKDTSLYVKINEIKDDNYVVTINYGVSEIGNKYETIERGTSLTSLVDVKGELSKNLSYQYEVIGLYKDASYTTIIDESSPLIVNSNIEIYVKLKEKPKEITLTENIEKNSYLNNTWIESVYIDNKVTSIEDNAFKGCSNLKSVTLSDNLSYIGNNVFDETNIEFNTNNDGFYLASKSNPYYLLYKINNENINNISKFTINNNTKMIYNKVFYKCIALEEINVPNNLIFIGNDAFNNCLSLESFVLLDSISYIGSKAFYHCDSLKIIVIPKKITTIKESAFAYCDSVETLNIPSNIKEIEECAFYACKDLVELTIDNGLQIIGNEAFANCINLIEIELPASVSSIGTNVFNKCEALNSIEIDDNNEYYDDAGNNIIIEISEVKIIASCKSSAIPDGVRIIGESAFADMESITSINIPDSVIEISKMAFANCKKLSIVSLSNNLKKIEQRAFYNCISLNNITLNEGLEEIGNGAFMNCSSLSYLNTPNSLMYLRANAFYNTNMSYYVILDNDIYIETHAFSQGMAIFTLKESFDEDFALSLFDQGIIVFYKDQWINDNGKPLFNIE